MSVLSSLAAAMKAHMPYFPKVEEDRWGNRGKYIPAGVRKNIPPNNR